MMIRSTISTNEDTRAAVNEICKAVAGIEADLAVLFASHHYANDV